MKNDSRKHIKIYLYIYIFTIILTFIIKNIFIINGQGVSLQSNLTANNIIDSCFFAVGPTIIGINVFNKYIWKFGLIRKLFAIELPYIEGRWEGTLLSTYTQHKKKHKIVIEFNQTLTRTSVWYYDENAVTHSVIADTVLDEEGGPAKVLCIYDNNPIINRDKNLLRHIGVMELFVLADENRIKGTYFNNPIQRNTYGEIDIKLISRKRKKVFKPDA